MFGIAVEGVSDRVPNLDSRGDGLHVSSSKRGPTPKQKLSCPILEGPLGEWTTHAGTLSSFPYHCHPELGTTVPNQRDCLVSNTLWMGSCRLYRDFDNSSVPSNTPIPI